MTRRSPPPTRDQGLALTLRDAAAAYQASAVIPHCPQCASPCCKLDKLVLELEWPQVKALWQRLESRPAFDRLLANGQGPSEIRAGNGLYYIHTKPCPAYDPAQGNCRVYGQPLKPAGCSDFPVYENAGEVVADLRCEAVDLKALEAWLSRALGPEFRLEATADDEFPFLVTLSTKRLAAGSPRPVNPVPPAPQGLWGSKAKPAKSARSKPSQDPAAAKGHGRKSGAKPGAQSAAVPGNKPRPKTKSSPPRSGAKPSAKSGSKSGR